MQRTELRKEGVESLIFAGNSTFSLYSENSGKWYTYNIRVSKSNPNRYNIYSLRGSNNTKDYVFIGYYYRNNKYLGIINSKTCDVSPPSLRAIMYFINKLPNIHPKLHVYNEGRCCRCGRKLTTPQSVKLGIGPECSKYFGGNQ